MFNKQAVSDRQQYVLMGKDTFVEEAPGNIFSLCPMRHLLLVMLSLLLFSGADAEDRELAGIFSRNGVKGTMVIVSLHSGKTFIHDESRASRRLPAASTFKILNTLIALEERAVAGKEEVVRWDGHRYDYPEWNRDQTLESAFRASCVWYYQELARRVGAGKYREYVGKCSYGELEEPFDGMRFWLDGSLRISAIEQVEFLRKVFCRELPFRATSFDTLREIMVVGNTRAYTLRAKTGWATAGDPQIGWYVGYVETAGEVWFFAANIDLHGQPELPLRQAVTLEALHAKGIID
jgi:beta-lactamase class D